MAEMSGAEQSLIGSGVVALTATVTAYISARVRPPKASVAEEWRDLAREWEARLSQAEANAREAQAESVRCDQARRRQDLLIHAVLLPEVRTLRAAAGLAPLPIHPSLIPDEET